MLPTQLLVAFLVAEAVAGPLAPGINRRAAIEARKLITVEDLVTDTVTKTIDEGPAEVWTHSLHPHPSSVTTTVVVTLTTPPEGLSTSTTPFFTLSTSSTTVSSPSSSSSSSAAVTSSAALPSSPVADNSIPKACSTSFPLPDTAPAIPTPSSTFNVDTYWGGDEFPFWVTQDVAPSFQGSDYVDLHNQYRALHGAAPMVLNSTLEAQAQGYMDAGCPNGDPSSGSNWFATTGAGDFAAGLSAWYAERSNYTSMSSDYLCNSFQSTATNSAGESVSLQDTGHFTQMVWNASTSVGCAISSTCSGFWTTQVLCLYYPAGNVILSVNGEEWPETLYNVYRPTS